MPRTGTYNSRIHDSPCAAELPYGWRVGLLAHFSYLAFCQLLVVFLCLRITCTPWPTFPFFIFGWYMYDGRSQQICPGLEIYQLKTISGKLILLWMNNEESVTLEFISVMHINFNSLKTPVHDLELKDLSQRSDKCNYDNYVWK